MTARENAETADVASTLATLERDCKACAAEVERLRGELSRVRLESANWEASAITRAHQLAAAREYAVSCSLQSQQDSARREEAERQLAEATGLLRNWRTAGTGGRCALHAPTDDFLSRAPAQAAEPVRDLDWAAAQIVAAARAANCRVSYSLESITHSPEAANCGRCRWADGCRRAESAEATIAAVRARVKGWTSSGIGGDCAREILALLAPSQGEGGGGK